jgi:hypothetical protein
LGVGAKLTLQPDWEVLDALSTGVGVALRVASEATKIVIIAT